MKIILKVQ